MLSVVGRTLREHGPMTAPQLARHVGSDEAAVLGMLDLLERKGKIVPERLVCGGCTSCDVSSVAYYRWRDGRPSGCAIGRRPKRAMIGG